MSLTRPILIYYEHPDWFRPLFTELGRRGIPTLRVHADGHTFDPADSPPPYAAVFNRMSPSAWKRGRAGSIFYTHEYLAWLESHGVDVINGTAAFRLETSKALQIALLAQLGLPAPRTRVVTSVDALPAAAESLTFPLVVKPNIGGSGAGIIRFDDPAALRKAMDDGAIATGVDGTLLLQEYHRPRANSIVRIETLAGRYLYAIRVHLGDHPDFNLCPADICCPAGASATSGLRATSYTPPAELIDAAERISRAAHIDVGGIEYLESARDGQIYFYDINALSNFVANPLDVIGFNPTERLVDALEARVLRRVA